MMDTLSYAEYLERNGFNHAQAQALAHATQQYVLPQIVTRDALRAELLAQYIKIVGATVAIGGFYTAVLLFVLK